MTVLDNKYFKNYSYLCRYAGCANYYHHIDNKYVTATAQQLNMNTPYSEYIVRKGDSYDKIALMYYNNPTYYWIICYFNNIMDPFTQPIPGNVIKVPDLAAIEFI